MKNVFILSLVMIALVFSPVLSQKKAKTNKPAKKATTTKTTVVPEKKEAQEELTEETPKPEVKKTEPKLLPPESYIEFGLAPAYGSFYMSGLSSSYYSSTSKTIAGYSVPLEVSYIRGLFIVSSTSTFIMAKEVAFQEDLTIGVRLEEGIVYSQYRIGIGLFVNDDGRGYAVPFDVAVGFNLSDYVKLEMIARIGYANADYDYLMCSGGIGLRIRFK